MTSLPEVRKGQEDGYVGMVQMYLLMAGSVGTDNPFFESSYAKKVGLDADKMDELYQDDYQGYLDAMDQHWTDCDFGGWTEEALQHFQVRHTARDGQYLCDVEDGFVGPLTWDALKHREATQTVIKIVPEAVETDLVDSAKEDKENTRKAVCMEGYKYLGVVEKPKGSNRGKWVDYFKGNTKRWAWCQTYVGRVYKDVTGHYPVGPESKPREKWYNDPGTARCRAYAKELGLFKPKRVGCKVGDQDAPEIGDMYSIYYGGGRGHTGLVVGLKLNSMLEIIGVWTLSGNENDGVREGYRVMSSKTLVGFIDPYGEDVILPEFKRDFAKVASSEGLKTR